MVCKEIAEHDLNIMFVIVVATEVIDFLRDFIEDRLKTSFVIVGASGFAVVMRDLICHDPFGVPPSRAFTALCGFMAGGTAVEAF